MKYRNINLLSINYAFQPRLRYRLTLRRLTLREETLDFRRECFSHSLSLLMSAFALLIPPAYFTICLHRFTERSSTILLEKVISTASVHGLSPVKSSARTDTQKSYRPVSYYAFFKGWLLLSQPPGCLGLPTSFPTEP